MAITKRIKLTLQENFADVDNIKRQSSNAFKKLAYGNKVKVKEDIENLIKSEIYKNSSEREQAFAIFKIIGISALDRSDTKVLDALTDNGMAFNILLANAVESNNYECAEVLLKNGANPDARLQGFYDQDSGKTYQNFTPVEYIAFHCKEIGEEDSNKFISLFLDYDANIDNHIVTELNDNVTLMSKKEMIENYSSFNLEAYEIARGMADSKSDRTKKFYSYPFLNNAEEELERRAVENSKREESIDQEMSQNFPLEKFPKRMINSKC